MDHHDLSADSIRKYYDEQYTEKRYMEDYHRLESFRLKDVMARIPDPIHRLLDYGCGQARWHHFLSNRFPHAGITGIDISDKALEVARARVSRSQFQCFDGDSAPFPDETFDLVFSYDVLEHVPNFHATVKDMARLVKKGGIICAIMPCGNRGSFEERIVRSVQKGYRKTASGEYAFFYEDPSHLRRIRTVRLKKLFQREKMVLKEAFFAHQFWGAIEMLSRSYAGFIHQLFDPQKSDHPVVRFKLHCFLWIFMILLLRGNVLSMESSFGRKTLYILMLPVRLAMSAVGRGLEAIAWMEWRVRRRNRNGSIQYLIFQKPL